MSAADTIGDLFPREREFYLWAARDLLMIRRCGRCRLLLAADRLVCTACHGTDLSPEAASGRGRLHAHTTIPRPRSDHDGPVGVGLVELDEGPRIVARVRLDSREPAVGDLAVVGFEIAGSDFAVPVFSIFPDSP